jgi:hypothetical protein
MSFQTEVVMLHWKPLEGAEDRHKQPDLASEGPDRGSNPELSEYYAGVLSTEPCLLFSSEVIPL